MNKEAQEKLWKKLDIYLLEFHQSSILLSDDSSDHRQFLENYCWHLKTSQKVAYIDFSETSTIEELAEVFRKQYTMLFDNIPEYYNNEEPIELNRAVELFSEINEDEPIYIWMDNFTLVDGWRDSEIVYQILRSIFQHQQNVVHIFVSINTKTCHQIFSNYDNPFFRFGAQIKV